MKRWMTGVLVLVLAIAVLTPSRANSSATTELRYESFDVPPQWIGAGNRQNPPCFTIDQAFAHGPNGIGGLVRRSHTFAYYGKPVGPKSFATPLSASGTFTIDEVAPAAELFFGWFNHNNPDWRKESSLFIRLRGTDPNATNPANNFGPDRAKVYLEYGTKDRLAGGESHGEQVIIAEDQPFLWRLRYEPSVAYTDPSGKAFHGRASLWLQSDSGPLGTYLPGNPQGKPAGTPLPNPLTLTVDLPEAHFLSGANFNRFGMTNRGSNTGAMEAYVAGLKIDGQGQISTAPSLSEPTGWSGANNLSAYTECVYPNVHNFGYDPGRRAAGGLIWRANGNPAWYADRIGYADPVAPRFLTLQHELYASGSLTPVRGATDSGIFVGWFHSQAATGCGAGGGLPEDALGVVTGGQSQYGERIWPTFRTRGTKSEKPALDASPLLRFNRNAQNWTLHYLPTVEGDGIARSGAITLTYGDRSVQVPITAGKFDGATRFDRFGIHTIDCDGQYQDVYLDDLTYTARQALP